MNDNAYHSYQWKYVDKKAKVVLIVFAREQKTADEIVAIVNTENVYYLKPARFFFRKPVMMKLPPYEVEQHQLEQAEKDLEYRRERLKMKPEYLGWIAKH